MITAMRGVPPARSRQEVVELIGVIGESDKALERIDQDRDETIRLANELADQQSEPIKAARAQAQAKAEAWFRIHPEQAASIAGSAAFSGDPMQAQLAAALMASARPLTERQRTVLEHLKDGWVLRRQYKRRLYSLLPAEPPEAPKLFLNSAQVFDLQVRFLDAFDPETGERLLTASAHDARKVEFRLKPGVVLP